MAEDIEIGGLPKPIDLTIGADHHSELVYEDENFQMSNGLTAVNTFLGWTLLGSMEMLKSATLTQTSRTLFLTAYSTPEDQLAQALRINGHWHR